MMMKKRLLSSALALALCLGMVPALPPARAANVTYEPKRLEAVVLPKAAAGDSAFLRTRVRVEDSPFHIDSGFKRVTAQSLSTSGSDDHTTLSPALSFMHSENEKWKASYRWLFTSDYETQKASALNGLILAGQLVVTAQAKLTPDKHSHLGSHSSLTDRAQLVITDHRNGIEVLKLQNGKSDGDGVGTVMEASGVPKDTHYLGFQVTMSCTDCSCGSSKVSNVYIHLSDVTAPTVSAIYPSDAGGTKTAKEYYKTGNTIYFTMEFSENIRFADDKIHDLTLKLPLIDNATGSTSTVLSSLQADLVALKENKLIFSCTVPNTQLDVQVGAVSPTAQSWTRQKTDLAILSGAGAVLDSTTFDADCPITDLAGNAMVWTSSMTMSTKTVIDTKAPQVTKVTATASMVGDYQPGADGEWPADIPVSAIWAGAWDTISFTVVVDEEVGYMVGNEFRRFGGYLSSPTATLNLENNAGSIKKTASSVEYRADSVNDGKISTIFHFGPIQVGSNMHLPAGEDYFRITDMSFQQGIYDPTGNPAHIDFTNFPPQEKFKLDVSKPTVTLPEEPLTEDDGTDATTFYRTVPFTIDDTGSGVDPETTKFNVELWHWDDSTVRWCVTDSPTRPTDDADYQTSEEFLYQPQAGGQMYLHAKVENVDPTYSTVRLICTVSARDYADNWNEAVKWYTVGTDTSAPQVTGTIDLSMARKITAHVQVFDNTSVEDLQYWWEFNGEAQDPVTVSAGKKSVSFAASTGYLTGQKGEATLHVYAEDPENRVTEKTFGPVDFDFSAQKANYTVGDPATPARKPVLTIAPPDDTDSSDYVTVAIIGMNDGSNNGFSYNAYRIGYQNDTAILEPFNAESAVKPAQLCKRPTELLNAGVSGAVTIHCASDPSSFKNFSSDANGEVEVFLVTGPKDSVSTSRLTIDASTTIEYFTIACGVGRSYGVSASGGTALVGSSTAVPANPVQTLTGKTVSVTVTPNVSTSFNFRDLDFSGARAWLEDVNGDVLEGSEQELPPATVGEGSYTFNYLIANQFPQEKVHCKLHVEIPYTESMADGETKTVSGGFWLYMDDEPFDDYYPVAYEQYYGMVSTTDPTYAALGLRQESLVVTDEESGTSYVPQLTVGLAEAPTTGFGYEPSRILTFAATRDGALLPLQVWTGETPPEDGTFLTNAAKTADGYYALSLVLGDGDDTDCDKELTLRAGENRVYYRVQLPNGTMTTTKVLTVVGMAQQPKAAITFTQAGNSLISIAVTPSDNYTAQQMDLTGNEIIARSVNNTGKHLQLDAARQIRVEFCEDNEYLANSSNYFLVDSYGNLGVATCEDEDWSHYASSYNVAQHFDLCTPTVTVEDQGTSLYGAGSYSLSITMEDKGNAPSWANQYNTKTGTLDLSTLQVSVTYTNADEESVTSTLTPPLPAGFDPDAYEAGGSWNDQITDGSGPFGMIYVGLENPDYSGSKYDNLRLSIAGILPPEARTAGGKVFTVTVSDDAGNVGQGTGTLTLTESIPEAITFTQSESGGNYFTSSSPVRLLSPIEEDTMWTSHDNLPFYQTGTYTVRFLDPFGNIHTQEVAYTAPDYYTVELSTEDKTTGEVTVTVTSTYNGSEGTGNLLGYTLGSEVMGTPSWRDVTHQIEGAPTLTVTLDANDTLYFWQDQSGGTPDDYMPANGMVRITNIVTAPETPPVSTAQVVWYDGDGQRLEGSVSVPVKGPVTALVECDDELTGDTRYMFPCGSAAGMSHTFTFTDSFGNERTLPAALPWAVAAAEQSGVSPADTDAPTYRARLYQQYGGLWQQTATFDSQLLGATLEDGSASPQSPKNLSAAMTNALATGWQAAFSAEDASQVKMVVKLTSAPVTYSSANDTGLPAGLTVGAASLTWTGETASPTVYVSLVDSFGNATEPLPVQFPGVYVPGKPTATVKYAYTDHNTVRAYLVPGENAEGFTVQDPDHKLTLDSGGGTYNGLYYYEFAENGSYTFSFTNAGGKSGSVTATVDTIDNREMKVTSVGWLAGGNWYDGSVEDGEVTWDQAEVFTNANVVAEVYTTLPIQTVEFPDSVAVSYAANKATVVFHDNTDAATGLRLFGRNGKVAALSFPAITCIDRTAPVVSSSAGTIENGVLTVSGDGKRTVTVTFTTNEKTSLDGGSELATEHTYTVSANGDYDLTFADRAGNVTPVRVTVTDLDGKLEMRFSKSSDGANATANPGKDWKGTLNGNDTFYVQFTRAVTASLAGGETKGYAKNVWNEFTVPAAGGLLTLRAEDIDGKVIYTYLQANSADSQPPTILFAAGTVYGKAGMAQAERDALLEGGVTVRDDRDTTPVLTVADSAVNWNAPGTYTVTYTATDDSGNAATATRTLVLLSQDSATIRINGEQAIPFGTKVLSTRELKVALEGVTGPVFVSVKPGRLTQAQMKLGAKTLLSNEAYTVPLTYTLTRSGFHTLYLRTQDRGGILIYLYVTD